MMTLNQLENDNVLSLEAVDRLETSDYEVLTARVEEMIGRFGKINVLVELRDFKGWTLGALWQDLKFDVKHFRDIGRLAVVGEKKWEKGLAAFSKPFTAAEVRYFDSARHDEARSWVQE